MKAIVVGAGITGVSAAEWLRRAGHEVTLVDRVRPGDPRQTSYGNAGLLARGAVVPVSVPGLWRKALGMALDPDQPLFVRWGYLPRMARWGLGFLRNGGAAEVGRIAAALAPLIDDAVDAHEALAAGTPAAAMITRGAYAYLYPDRASFAKDAFGWDLRRRHGFSWEEWERERIAAEVPGLAPRYRFAAVLAAHGWIADPGAYVAALAEHFEREGGRFVEASVTAIDPTGDGARVTLEGGETLEAPQVVLAAGVWATAFAKRLGHRTAMEAERGYHVHLAGAAPRPSMPLMITDAKTAVTPMATGVRFAGTAEFAGTDAPERPHAPALIRRRIRDVFPDLTWEREEVWMGRRPSTIDSLPLLGRSPRAPGVVFAFGGQHLGLTMGPRLGRLAAGIAAGERTNVDLAPYSVERFGRA